MAEKPSDIPVPEAGVRDEPAALPRCTVVGIGASAGGVRALQAFFESLPDQLSAAFVVIVHLDPNRHSELPNILAGRTSMPVVQVSGVLGIEPGRVYVIPPNRQLIISDHEIATAQFDEPRSERRPIDQFFRSLAKERGDGIAIVLSGSGSDGTVGIKAVKEAGGVVLVQDPQEAEFGSMPGSAIATGVADFVLPVRHMGKQLIELLRSKERLRQPDAGLDDDEIVHRIMALLRSRSGHDFSGYKRSTVMRRLARRMQIVKSDRLQDYQKYLQENVEEAQALFSDLLISVTSFFRDPNAFKTLANVVIPKLFDGKTKEDSIRAWVPGCATGEEAYSIAMLLLEESARCNVRPNIQVFASDLDSGALATAREGRYPPAIEADVSEGRLHDFFFREGDHYHVKKGLRDIVLFATHSLLRDPPFSRLDLVSCRNLLIYLDRNLQRQACNILAYALSPGGYLFLGSSEGMDGSLSSVRLIDRHARIFQSTGRTPLEVPNVLRAAPMSVLFPPAAHPPREHHGGRGEFEAHWKALEKLAPPSILVDEDYRVLNLSESAGHYLLHPAGPLTNDVTELVRPELGLNLRSGLHRAFDFNETSLSLPIAVQFNSSPRQVYLQVRPIPAKDAPRRALVLFIDGEPIQEAAEDENQPPDRKRDTADGMRQIREELNSIRDRLRQSQTQRSEAIEELRAANEELQSTNEEYRSTAEELETSKEELQSTNEELQTVNNELKLKLEVLSRAHSDIENLIASSEVGTLFLDSELRIKRFTPPISRLFNIAAGDEGRPITDFTHRLEYGSLESDARLTMNRLAPIEHELKSSNGRWYLTRFSPYRNVEGKFDGVVVTFVDVTSRRQTEEDLRESETRLKLAREAADLGILDYDPIGERLWMDERCRELWGLGSDEPVTMDALLARMYPDDLANFRAVLKAALTAETSGGYAAEFRTLPQNGGDGRWVRANGKVFFNEEGSGRVARRLIVTIQDVTEVKTRESEQELLLAELSHRVKNTMAVVQSMARQTLPDSGADERALEAFEGRLAALSKSHELLLEQKWRGAGLKELTETQLSPFAATQAERIDVHGPAVVLDRHLTTAFALLIHELGTNAAKYGALSNPNGRLEVSWRLKPDSEPQVLQFVWREHGMTGIKKPRTFGFGSFLIEQGVPEATVVRDFRAEGLICTLELPLEVNSSL